MTLIVELCKISSFFHRGCLLRVFRLARVIDSLGLPHSSEMLRIVLVALKTCVKETLVIISIFTIAAMLFSTMIFSFEFDPLDEENGFESIPAIMWFCIVTMTTVGYGEIYPQTTGKSKIHLDLVMSAKKMK